MGYEEPKWLTPKSCVLNILTSKFFDINILQTLFANPAPSKAFRGYGGGGIPLFRPSFPNREQRCADLFQQEIHSLAYSIPLPDSCA
jgi:hypothetical protein